MNNHIQFIAESLLGNKPVNIILGGKNYEIHPPTIEIIARMAIPLSEIKKVEVSNLQDPARQLNLILDSVAIAYAGANSTLQKKLPAIRKQMSKATIRELATAFETLVSLIIPKDFFVCATLAMEVAKIVVKPV